MLKLKYNPHKKKAYLVAWRLELASSKSGSGDGASDRELFIKPVVKLDDVVLSIAFKLSKKKINNNKKDRKKATQLKFN